MRINNIKKIFLGVSLFVALGISYSFIIPESVELISNQSTIEKVECTYGQCHAKAKSTGKRCKHCVSNKGDKNCWQHK
jgi:hypothetical protein|tara:strand:+ start:27382 stop:27615 length:234 start_codon:yes stop_codon:yes gene_type:complete